MYTDMRSSMMKTRILKVPTEYAFWDVLCSIQQHILHGYLYLSTLWDLISNCKVYASFQSLIYISTIKKYIEMYKSSPNFKNIAYEQNSSLVICYSITCEFFIYQYAIVFGLVMVLAKTVNDIICLSDI